MDWFLIIAVHIFLYASVFGKKGFSYQKCCHICRAGYGSESEADDEAATVTLASDYGRINRASSKSAVKLQEIGPRMTLQLIKIEEGLCSGPVIFSAYGNYLPFILSVILDSIYWIIRTKFLFPLPVLKGDVDKMNKGKQEKEEESTDDEDEDEDSEDEESEEDFADVDED